MKSFMGVFLFALAFSGLVAGCGSLPISSAGHEAHAAQLRGDWTNAVQLWNQAIQEQKGFWKEEFAAPSGKFAVLYYELGRSEGVICQWDASMRDLNHALDLDEKSRGPVWMDLLELGRLCHARGNNIQADVYFDRLFDRMPFDEMMRRDPDGLVASCDEAADIAAALGKSQKSAQFQAKAASVRQTHPKARIPKDWTPYGLGCRTSSPSH